MNNPQPKVKSRPINIADVRFESITTELREFKTDTKQQLNKIEGWIIAIVGTTVTTLLTVVVALALKMIG